MRRIVQLKKRQEELEDGPLNNTLQAMDSLYAQQDATWVHTALPFHTRGVAYGMILKRDCFMHELCVCRLFTLATFTNDDSNENGEWRGSEQIEATLKEPLATDLRQLDVLCWRENYRTQPWRSA
jgi:hypothetical protein